MLQSNQAARVKLATAYNAVVQNGKVLDVSKLTENGTGWKSTNYPKGDANGVFHGTKKWVGQVPVVSDNYQTYALAMRLLGPEFEPFANEFFRQHGGQKLVRSPKVVKPPTTRRTPKSTAPIPGGFIPAPLGSVPVPLNQYRVPAVPIQQMNVPTRLSPRQTAMNTAATLPILPQVYAQTNYTLPQTRLSPSQSTVPTIPLRTLPVQLPQLSPRSSALPQLSPRQTALPQLSPMQTELPQLSPRQTQAFTLPQVPTLRQ